MTAAANNNTGVFDALWGEVRWGRFLAWLIAGVLLMIMTLIAWHIVEQFLIKDGRFRIAGADDFAGQSPNLIVEGTHYASASQIRHLFREDFGRSLYLVPIQQRRRQLLAIDWIEDASVSKIWPKTLKVQIKERVPVAFVHLRPNAKDGMWRYALIDRDGFVLRPKVAARFTLPVITGIAESEPVEDRRAKVARVLSLLRDLGNLRENISEIDVSDASNIVLAEHAGDTVVNLEIGDENFAERLQNFLANYPEIHSKRPDVKTLDLRVDGVITAVGEQRRAR